MGREMIKRDSKIQITVIYHDPYDVDDLFFIPLDFPSTTAFGHVYSEILKSPFVKSKGLNSKDFYLGIAGIKWFSREDFTIPLIEITRKFGFTFSVFPIYDYRNYRKTRNARFYSSWTIIKEFPLFPPWLEAITSKSIYWPDRLKAEIENLIICLSYFKKYNIPVWFSIKPNREYHYMKWDGVLKYLGSETVNIEFRLLLKSDYPKTYPRCFFSREILKYCTNFYMNCKWTEKNQKGEELEQKQFLMMDNKYAGFGEGDGCDWNGQFSIAHYLMIHLWTWCAAQFQRRANSGIKLSCEPVQLDSTSLRDLEIDQAINQLKIIQEQIDLDFKLLKVDKTLAEAQIVDIHLEELKYLMEEDNFSKKGWEKEDISKLTSNNRVVIEETLSFLETMCISKRKYSNTVKKVIKDEEMVIVRNFGEIESILKEPKLWFRAGILANKLFNPNKAELFFQQAIVVQSDYVKAWYHLGRLLEEQGRLIQAEKGYKEVLKIEPNNIETLYRLGMVYRRSWKVLLATKAFKSVIMLDKENIKAWLSLAIINRYKDKKISLEAYRYVNRLAEIDITILKDIVILGRILHENGHLQESKILLQKAVRTKSDSFETVFLLGKVILDQKGFDEADNHFEIALNLNPKRLEDYEKLGTILADNRRFLRAEKAYMKSLESKSIGSYKKATIWNKTGKIRQACKRYTKAIEAFQTALKYNSDYKPSKDNLQKVLNILEKENKKQKNLKDTN